MKTIIKNLMLACTLIACGLGETLEAVRGSGGRGGGKGGGGRGGSGKVSGGSRIRSSGPTRVNRVGGYKGTGIKKIGGYKGNVSRYHSGKYARGGNYRSGRFYHGGYGRRWGHRYSYNYGLYPWGVYLLTRPWWRNYDWDYYYTTYPSMRYEIDQLRAQLEANTEAMRRKDRQLAALEDRLDDALDANAQAGLKNKIAKLKHALRKQAEITQNLDAQLKEKTGKN